MDSETLERLLIDRELGELSPDVEALLDACLEARPEDAVALQATAGTVELAREALCEDLPKSMPALPIDGFAQIERWQRRWQRLTYGLGLAACLVIGFGIGWFVLPTQESEQPSEPRVVVLDNTSPPSVAASNDQTDSMWSVKRWLEKKTNRPQSHRGNRSRQLIWESPVERPRLRGEI